MFFENQDESGSSKSVSPPGPSQAFRVSMNRARNIAKVTDSFTGSQPRPYLGTSSLNDSVNMFVQSPSFSFSSQNSQEEARLFSLQPSQFGSSDLQSQGPYSQGLPSGHTSSLGSRSASTSMFSQSSHSSTSNGPAEFRDFLSEQRQTTFYLEQKKSLSAISTTIATDLQKALETLTAAVQKLSPPAATTADLTQANNVVGLVEELRQVVEISKSLCSQIDASAALRNQVEEMRREAKSSQEVTLQRLSSISEQLQRLSQAGSQIREATVEPVEEGPPSPALPLVEEPEEDGYESDATTSSQPIIAAPPIDVTPEANDSLFDSQPIFDDEPSQAIIGAAPGGIQALSALAAQELRVAPPPPLIQRLPDEQTQGTPAETQDTTEAVKTRSDTERERKGVDPDEMETQDTIEVPPKPVDIPQTLSTRAHLRVILRLKALPVPSETASNQAATATQATAATSQPPLTKKSFKSKPKRGRPKRKTAPAKPKLPLPKRARVSPPDAPKIPLLDCQPIELFSPRATRSKSNKDFFSLESSLK